MGLVTHQNSSIHFVPICFDLGIRYGIVIQHRLQVGPVSRQMWVEDSLHSLMERREQLSSLAPYALLNTLSHKRATRVLTGLSPPFPY